MKLRSLALALAFAAAFSAAWGEDACPPLQRLSGVDLKMSKGGQIAATVQIAGEPALFLISTGAARSEISRALAEKLKLPLSHSAVTLVDTNGRTSQTLAHAHDLQIGRLNFGSIHLKIMTADPPPELPQGVIGGDILRNYDIDFDFAARKMNIISREHCPGKVVYWPSQTLAKLPMMVGDDNRISFKMRLDGHELETVLDTGLSHTAINMAVAKTVYGLDKTSPDVTPANAQTPNGRYRHRFKSLGVEGLEIGTPDIMLIPDIASVMPGSLFLRGGDRFNARLQLHQPDLILGMSTLKKLHAYIDYHNQTVYLTPAAPPPPAQ
jgi:predicted aspartyl protease